MLTLRRRAKSLHPDTVRLDFAEAQAKREGFMPQNMSLRQHIDQLIRYYENREKPTKQT